MATGDHIDFARELLLDSLEKARAWRREHCHDFPASPLCLDSAITLGATTLEAEDVSEDEIDRVRLSLESAAKDLGATFPGTEDVDA